MKKLIIVLFLIMVVPLVSSFEESQFDFSYPAYFNYSIVNVNHSLTSDYATSSGYSANSGQLEGRDTSTLKTYFEGLYDLVYVNIGGDTMTGDLNINADLTARNATFENVNITQDLFVSNSTIYVGNISLSSANGDFKVGGNVNATYYYGDGSFLQNLNLTGISFDGGNITADNFVGGNFSGDYFNVQGEIRGGFIDRYDSGNFNGALYTSGTNSSLSSSNSLFQVQSDTRGTPQFLVQDGGAYQASFITRSFMVVNQNNTLLNSSQNNDCRSWGFNQIDCNTATTGADLGVTDDIQALGLIYASGLRSYNREGKQRAPLILSENITTIFNGSNGSYDATTNYFCDNVYNSFVAIDGWININDINSNFEGAWSNIGEVVNSSCVELVNNPGWTKSFNNTKWRIVNDPELIYLLGGFGEFYIGDSERSAFEFNARNGTGTYSVVIDDTSGANSHEAFRIEQDINGFNTIAQSIFMKSSKQIVNKQLTMLSLEAEATNMNSSSGVFIDMNVIGQPLNTNGEIDGIHMTAGLNHIIKVGAADTISKVYYNQRDITTNSTTVGLYSQVFSADNDIIYIGNKVNFTNIGVSLSSVSSAPINARYYYCDNTGNWKTLTAVTYTTGGWTSSGIITFTSPTDRGVCNKQINGTAFTNTTSYSYIAIQRTRNNIVTPPILDTLTISGAGSSMFLSDAMLKLNPVDTAPRLCSGATLGAIYFDISEDNMCVCKSTGWKIIETGADCV